VVQIRNVDPAEVIESELQRRQVLRHWVPGLRDRSRNDEQTVRIAVEGRRQQEEAVVVFQELGQR
jgi:hypothetical protein